MESNAASVFVHGRQRKGLTAQHVSSSVPCLPTQVVCVCVRVCVCV